MSRTETYAGAGTMYLQRRNDPNAKLLSVGNLAKLSIEWDVETKKLANYQSVSGGTFDAYTDIRGGKVSLDITQFFASNIALLVYGSQEEIAAQANKTETHKAMDGSLIKLELIPKKGTLTVLDSADNSIIYQAGRDYTETASGILISNTGTITDGSDIDIQYSTDKQHRFETLVESGAEYSAVIEGLNKADSGRPFIITLHRIKFGPGGLDIITDDFRKTAVTGEMMQAPEIQATGKSAYATIQQLAA